MRDGSDLLAFGVVDPDASTHVAWVVVLDASDLAPCREYGLHSLAGEEALVVAGNHEDLRTHGSDQLGKRVVVLRLAVEGALALPTVGALLGDAVDGGSVPPHERLPNVIVAEVGVLVVGRIDVGDVGLEAACCLQGFEAEGAPLAERRPWQKCRQPEREVVARPRRPALQVGHLHTGGRIDAIGSFEQGNQHDRLELGFEAELRDPLPNGLDAGAVLRLEVARSLAIDLSEPTGASREELQFRDQLLGVRDHVF